MTFDEIESVLGIAVVRILVDTVSNAHGVAGSLGNEMQVRQAITELLLALLCAAIITPPDGAIERAETATERLLTIVEKSVQMASQRPSHQPCIDCGAMLCDCDFSKIFCRAFPN